MKVANIVTTSKIVVPEIFNVVPSMEEAIDGLPTLLVGYQLANKFNPDFDITEIKLDDNIYWTFKKTEKRDKYEEDLRWFLIKTFSDLTNEIDYVFVDPIQYRPKTLLKILKKIYSIKNKITYLDGEMLYIYGEQIVFGINLELLRFIGLNTEKILFKIKRISDVFLIKNEILIEYKNYIETLYIKAKYLPYLYFIVNEKNSDYSSLYISREG